MDEQLRQMARAKLAYLWLKPPDSLSLREKRVLFSWLVAVLVQKAIDLGLEPAFDQVRRTAAEAKANARKGSGIANSLHTLGLAADVLLYKDIDDDGRPDYLTQSEAYAELGRFWKTLHPLCRWGGDFRDSKGRPKPDGNHFSMEHNGVK